jgi:hypothetical protein
MSAIAQEFFSLLGSATVTVAILVAGSETLATNISICQPPAASEYLLLVVSRTQENQVQVQKLLPPSASIAVCTYLNDTVTRIGGFRTMDRANAWARYITETTGLAAYVVRPAEVPSTTIPPTSQLSTASPSPTASPLPNPSPSSTPPIQPTNPATKPSGTAFSSYNPKTLGAGYAVLVDYFNQPELASKVKQALGKEIGLVAYGQRPYLLARYTTDQSEANSILQTLSDRGFWATVVDSRRVILLRQSVEIDPGSK